MNCCICGKDLTGLPAMVDKPTGEAFCERDAHYFGQHPSNRPPRPAPEVTSNRPQRPAPENPTNQNVDVKSLIVRFKNTIPLHRQSLLDEMIKMGALLVDSLIVALQDSDVNVRKGAADVLGELKATRAVESLIAALQDSDINVRGKAMDALGKIGDPRAVRPLIKVLDNRGDLETMNAVIEALRKIGYARVVEPLVTILKDSDGGMRFEAARALNGLGWKPADNIQRAFHQIALNFWEHPEEHLGADAVEPLILNLWDKKRKAGWSKTARSLGNIGDARAIEPLTALLKDSDEDVRQSAAEALHKIDPASFKADPNSLQRLAESSLSFYGLSIVDGNEIKYSGPLIKMEQSGDDIPKWVQQVFHNKPSSHFLILPQMGMMIIILSASDFHGMQFTSPMSKEVAAQLLSSMSSKTVRMVEQFGAIELQGDKITDGLSKEKISSTVKEPSAEIRKSKSIPSTAAATMNYAAHPRTPENGAADSGKKNLSTNLLGVVAFIGGVLLFLAGGCLLMIYLYDNSIPPGTSLDPTTSIGFLLCCPLPFLLIGGVLSFFGFRQFSRAFKCVLGFHQWSEWSTISNSCEQDRECRRCRQRETKAAVHDWEDWNYIPNDCEQERECRRCHQQETKAAVHDWEDWKYRSNSCEQERECRRCHQRDTKTAVHDWDDWIPPEDKIHETRRCKRCSLIDSRIAPLQPVIGKTQSMSTPSDYSRYTKAFIYCRQGFDPRTLRLPGFTGKAEVIRSGSVVERAEIVAYMLMAGCDKYCILASPPDYGVGFIK